MERTESMQLEFSLNEAKNGLVVRGATVDGEVVIPCKAEYEGRIYPVREISRKELLRRADASFVWKEVWPREKGHMWENYTLQKRVPSEEELDYADCSQYAVWLKDLSTETIVKLLNEYKV